MTNRTTNKNTSSWQAKAYLAFSWVLFSILFTYVLLRAYYINPLHDELASFFHYIETGRIIGEGIVQDANNHLLNSYLGRLLYLLFGENFFVMRLPNVLAFGMYFWGIHHICKQVDSKLFRVIILCGLTCIPYLLDYFAYLRGYGLAIGFFIWMLIYFQKWVLQPTPVHLLLTYAFGYAAVFSNLTYLISCLFTMGLVIIIQFLRFRKFSGREHLWYIMAHGSLLLTLVPFFWFTYLLKNGGALYYGSLNGLWEVTGKSLSRYVFFYDANFLKWIFILFLIVIGVMLFIQLKKRGVLASLGQMNHIIPLFLIGNLGAILFSAFAMHVNYPEDRTGMFLIPLFLLSVMFLLYEHKKLRYGLILLFFFHYCFLTKMNLTTSEFSPSDRMANHFYNDVRSQLEENTTVAGYPLMCLTWPCHERGNDQSPVMLNPRRVFSPYFDVVLTNNTTTPVNRWADEYDTISIDPLTSHIALKRKFPLSKFLVATHNISFRSTKKEYIDLVRIPLSDTLNFKVLQISIEGLLSTTEDYDNLSIVFSTINKKGERVNYEYFNQRWYHGSKKHKVPLNINYIHSEPSVEEHEMIVYLWNPQKNKLQLREGNLKIQILKRTKCPESKQTIAKKT